MDILANERERFISFEVSQRLDEFFFSIVSQQSYSKEFVFFGFELILTISHGQACLDTGLNINDTVLLTNMKPNTFIAWRILIDDIHQNDLKMHNLLLSSKLI